MSSVEKVIQISSLSKRFKDLLAVDELELHVNRGDVFGFSVQMVLVKAQLSE